MSKKEFKPNNSPRNGKRTVLIVCTSLLAVVLCAVSVTAFYINHMLNKIDYENTPGQEDGQSVVQIKDDKALWNDEIGRASCRERV